MNSSQQLQLRRIRPLLPSVTGLALAILTLMGSPEALRAGTLGDALDSPALTWTTGGDAEWFYQTATNHDGVDAAQCGNLTASGQTSWLETTVTGRVSVVYWWKLSSDPRYYTLYVQTNGSWWSPEGYGERDWQMKAFSFEGGTNTIRWIYSAPSSDPTNWAGNALWLDQVLVTNIADIAPVFLLQPPSTLDVPENGYHAVSLSAQAVGDIPMTLQWQRDGADLPEGWPFYSVTSPSLTIYPLTQAECGGDFRLVASNQWGVATSAVCTVTVVPSPPFVPPGHPADKLIARDEYYYMYAQLYGSPPFAFQWYTNGTPVPGATNQVYYFYPATTADNGAYHFVVTNPQGTVTSRVAQVTVSADPPTIASEPSPAYQEVASGDSASVYAQAAGPEWLYYSWRRVGEADELGNWQGLNLGNLDPTNSGLYRVTAYNLNGAVTSRVSVLAVAPVTALGVALDAPGLVVTNHNDWWPQWTPDVAGATAHDGLCAARSPEIGDYEAYTFGASVAGPTNVSFWWRISAGTQAFLEVSVDGSVSNSISGETAWQQQTLSLPAGDHHVAWTFRKEEAGQVGQDAAWVDQLALGGDAPPPSSEITNFLTGGATEWYLQSANTHDGVDAWQSGLLNDSEENWIETTVVGPGSLTFWWMVESEEGCDTLTFSIEGVAQTNLSGVIDWRQEAFLVPDGNHTLRWTYSKDGSAAVSPDAGWLDEVCYVASNPPPPFTLEQALNATNLTFTTGGEAPWYPQTAASHDGVAAAQSGAAGDYGESWFETGVTGPGTLSFWWKVSSEQDADSLQLWADNALARELTGERDWEQVTLELGSGWHPLRWRYTKDGSNTNGADAGWVDQVQFVQPATATLNLKIIRETNEDVREWFYLFPELISVTPDVITKHLVQSPNAFFQGAINGEWGSSSRVLYTLDSLIDECTNGVWTLFINQGDPSEKRYTFAVSISGLDTIALCATTIHSPAQGATNVPPNPSFLWSGPTNLPTLWAAVRSLEGGASSGVYLPSTATNWPSAPTLSTGTNQFEISYTLWSAPDVVSFTLPEDEAHQPLEAWNAISSLHSAAKSTFVVSPVPVAVLLNIQPAADGLLFSFQTQAGRTHTIEARTNLTYGTWEPLTNFPGDGSLWHFAFPVTNPPARFFRAQTE